MKKFKNILITILCLIVVICSSIIIIVCNPDSNHEHTFESTWTANATEHWRKATCEHDVVTDKAEHSDINNDSICDVCNYDLITANIITSETNMNELLNSLDNSTQSIIRLNSDVTNTGIISKSDNPANIVLDLNNHTYSVNSAVGSAGTESQALHFERGCKVYIKNGVIKASSDNIKMLVQNYADLILENVVLDFRGSGYSYALSNNCGNVLIKGNTQILVDEGKVAFDLYFNAGGAYPEGVSVTFDETFTGKVDGNIEYGSSAHTLANWEQKTVLNIKGNGLFTANSLIISGTETPNINIFGSTFTNINVDAYRK